MQLIMFIILIFYIIVICCTPFLQWNYVLQEQKVTFAIWFLCGIIASFGLGMMVTPLQYELQQQTNEKLPQYNDVIKIENVV
jgi:hypothetical protein